MRPSDIIQQLIAVRSFVTPSSRGSATRARAEDVQLTKITTVLKGLGLVLVILAVSGCAPRVRDFGYAPSDAELNEIVVGVDSQDRVSELVGFPASQSLRGDDAWYYLSARHETVGMRAPQITDRQLVAISFKSEGTVRNVERFTIEDGRIVTLSRRVTDNRTKGIGILRQAFGNLGRISADQIAGN